MSSGCGCLAAAAAVSENSTQKTNAQAAARCVTVGEVAAMSHRSAVVRQLFTDDTADSHVNSKLIRTGKV